MRSLLFLTLTSASVASAQFSGLSATADGSSLYFSSTLRLRGTTESFYGKIFALDADGPRLAQARDPGPRVFNTPPQFYNLVAPQVADDGSVLAFTGTGPCVGSGLYCLTAQTAEGTIVDSTGQEILHALGYVNISPNGRWAVFSGRNTFAAPSLSGSDLVDLSTGMQVHVPHSYYGPTRRRIANDGAIAFFDSGSIVLWRSDGQQTISDPRITTRTPYPEPTVMISNDGARVVYQNVNSLVLYDRTLARGILLTNSTPTSVTISDDAHIIAWISGDQIGITSLIGVQVPTISEGVAEVALSGDGQTLFASTKNGRILRIELPSGASTELIARTPWITNPPDNYPFTPLTGISGSVAAGSPAIISGTGLSDLTLSAAPPIVGGLGDVHILIGGMDVPLEAISPSLVWFQVPWELAPQDYPLQYLSGSSPFETDPTTITVQSAAPQFFRNAYGDVVAVHGDWSGLVVYAHQGELIHVYVTGLGPVNSPVPTGAATPDAPLSYIAESLTCKFFGQTASDAHDATVEFAGLAPDMVGIYQVDLRVPDGLLRPVPVYTFEISCGFGPGLTASGDIGLIP
jgi:uncharacterized protein (TIGR03437 family)